MAIEGTASTLVGLPHRAGCFFLGLSTKKCELNDVDVEGSQSEAHLLLPPILVGVDLRALTSTRSRLTSDLTPK